MYQWTFQAWLSFFFFFYEWELQFVVAHSCAVMNQDSPWAFWKGWICNGRPRGLEKPRISSGPWTPWNFYNDSETWWLGNLSRARGNCRFEWRTRIDAAAIGHSKHSLYFINRELFDIKQRFWRIIPLLFTVASSKDSACNWKLWNKPSKCLNVFRLFFSSTFLFARHEKFTEFWNLIRLAPLIIN